MCLWGGARCLHYLAYEIITARPQDLPGDKRDQEPRPFGALETEKVTVAEATLPTTSIQRVAASVGSRLQNRHCPWAWA